MKTPAKILLAVLAVLAVALLLLPFRYQITVSTGAASYIVRLDRLTGRTSCALADQEFCWWVPVYEPSPPVAAASSAAPMSTVKILATTNTQAGAFDDLIPRATNSVSR